MALKRKMRQVVMFAAILYQAADKTASAQVVLKESILDARSIAEVGNSLRPGQSWPKLERHVVNDRKFAISLIAKCRSEHEGAFVNPSQETINGYVRLMSVIKESGGYLNGVMKDTVYRIAINDIAGLMVQHPDKSVEAEKLLELLAPGPWDSGDIGKILGETGGPGLEREFASWPPNAVFGRLLKKFNKGPFGSERRSSVIIDTDLPLDLTLRIMETDLIARYSLPGLAAYLGRGGDIRRLSNSDVSELSRVMGRDVYRYTYPLLNLDALLGVHVVNVIKLFGDTAQASRFLTDALN